MNKRLSDSLKGIAVDMGHVVVDSVPGGTEGTLGTIGIIGDDIDAGDLRHTVYREMVVGDTYALSRWEETAEANSLSGAPHTIDNTTRIAKRLLLLIELGTLATNHVEEDAVAGLITLYMRIGRPVLSTESPGVTRVVGLFPLGEAPVFSIETEEVEAK